MELLKVVSRGAGAGIAARTGAGARGASVGGFAWAGEALCTCFGSALGGGIDGFLDLAARKGDV